MISYNEIVYLRIYVKSAIQYIKPDNTGVVISYCRSKWVSE